MNGNSHKMLCDTKAKFMLVANISYIRLACKRRMKGGIIIPKLDTWLFQMSVFQISMNAPATPARMEVLVQMRSTGSPVPALLGIPACCVRQVITCLSIDIRVFNLQYILVTGRQSFIDEFVFERAK